MKKVLLTLVGTLLAFSCLSAQAGNDKADIKVMTQNQYLGADLDPIILATTELEYAVAVASTLQSIAANNFQERALALGESIADRQPHLVALQEVFAFECLDFGSGTCAAFQGAFNDHLALTMSALDSHGADYYVAADIQNLTIPTPFMESLGLPGLPVYLQGIEGPAMFIRVIDRDVILARDVVVTNPVSMNCPRPEPDGSGCNYVNIATVTSVLAGPIAVERGFVAVDAWVKDAEYRFVNTHLEPRFPSEDPLSPGLQAAQTTELNFAIALTPSNPGSRLIVAGDINSAPVHEPIGPFVPPYQQFANGLTIYGTAAFTPMTDTWLLRPGNPDDFTCCESANLLNASSEHYERIDVIFARPVPAQVKANVMDAESTDKTASGLWPSDHASVIAELTY
jgi:endonuclease/exonuclease/phosphatase family metal-dependent hydrolase